MDEHRIGLGYDVHSLEPDLPLVLGGCEIPFVEGLAGHSDADVLLHAVIDALLGAAGAGDIGQHFPPGRKEYKNISSCLLLERTGEILSKKGFEVINIDVTIIMEKPRLQKKHREEMLENIEDSLDIAKGRVNIKATTSEGLGFVGRGEGIAAQAAVMVRRIQSR